MIHRSLWIFPLFEKLFFCLCFNLDSLYCYVFKFIDLFFCSVGYAGKPIWLIFVISYIVFSALEVPFYYFCSCRSCLHHLHVLPWMLAFVYNSCLNSFLEHFTTIISHFKVCFCSLIFLLDKRHISLLLCLFSSC